MADDQKIGAQRLGELLARQEMPAAPDPQPARQRRGRDQHREPPGLVADAEHRTSRESPRAPAG
jgi:hypothetical protein